MFCKYCGRELKAAAKFCSKCGKAAGAAAKPSRPAEAAGKPSASAVFAVEKLSAPIPPRVSGGDAPATNHPKKAKRKPWVAIACAASACATLILVGFLAKGIWEQRSLEAAIEESGAVTADLQTLGVQGYVDDEGIAKALASVEDYARSDEARYVRSYEAGDDYVEMELTSGITYVYAPARPNTFSAGVDMCVNTYETTAGDESIDNDRDDVVEERTMTITPDTIPLGDNSLVDACAWHIINKASLGSFHMLDDDRVTLSMMRQFRKRELVLWEGHGGYTDSLGSYLVLTIDAADALLDGSCDLEELLSKALICVNGKIGVTAKFFEENYDKGDLDGAFFYLGTCSSLKDDRLANSLLDKGAIGVLGNTDVISTFYQFLMRDVIVSEMADKEATLEEALTAAKSIYGDHDFWEFYTSHAETEIRYLPQSAGNFSLYVTSPEDAKGQDADETETDESTPSKNGGDSRLIADFAQQHQARSYSAEYLYRTRAASGNESSYESSVGEGLPDSSIIGSYAKDFDRDGSDELLIARWQDGTVYLEMYEARNGSVSMADSAPAFARDYFGDQYPVSGDGEAVITCNDDGAIYVQWWGDSKPIANGAEWMVKRIDYNGTRFEHGDTYGTGGSGSLPLGELKSDMGSIGLDTSYVPAESFDDFTYTSIADQDSSLTVITRLTSWVDIDEVASLVIREMSQGGDSWSSWKYLGTFEVEPGA